MQDRIGKDKMVEDRTGQDRTGQYKNAEQESIGWRRGQAHLVSGDTWIAFFCKHDEVDKSRHFLFLHLLLLGLVLLQSK